MYVHMSCNKEFIYKSSGQVTQHQRTELLSNNNTNSSNSSNNMRLCIYSQIMQNTRKKYEEQV
jgi:hypothetical protein